MTDESPAVALMVDYAGVLTPGVAASWRSFERDHGMESGRLFELLLAAYESGGDDDPVAKLERGEMELADFEQQMAAGLREAGHDVEADGLVERLFADLRPAGGVWDLVRDVHEAGIPTVLVSNSWGLDSYPRAMLDEVFDALVLSGEVGMRKPDRDIFEHAAGLVDVQVEGSVFIDDARPNVEAAERHGMTGVLHTGDDEATRAAVTAALGL